MNKILRKTVNEPSPTLDRAAGYSKAMKEFVDWCLVKDPSQR